MYIILTGKSAMEYWLDGTNKYYEINPGRESIPEDFSFPSNKKIAGFLAKEYGLTLPICAFVSNDVFRQKTDEYFLQRFPKNLPENSFIPLHDRRDNLEVYVACPELAFLQAAEKYPLCIAVKIGCMLCAQYVRDDEELLGQRDRFPVASVKKITKYLKSVQNVNGIKNARMAIQYVSDGCNSPMEVNMATIGRLPPHCGGYGLTGFEMNGEMKMSLEAERILRRKTLRGDMVWKNQKVDVEYESNLTHLGKEQHAYDKKRSTAIILSGYKVINVTADNFSSLSKADETFFMIKKTLGQKIISKRFYAHQEVRREVFQKTFHQNIFMEIQNEGEDKYF